VRPFLLHLETKADDKILAEHQAKGLEEQALEADVAKKTKAAKRRAAKRGAATGTASAAPVRSRSVAVETPVRSERPRRGQLLLKSMGCCADELGRRRAAVESDEEDEE
jgi:condensin complex subunit 1